MLRWLKWFCVVLVVTIAGLALAFLYQLRDRNPGYSVSISHHSVSNSASLLKAGFGRVNINPDLSNPSRPVCLAGFSNGRSATGIHDDLMAVATVLDDGRFRLGIVVLDAIGFMHDDVIAVRKSIPADLRLDYTVVCSTHNHSTPDLMGIWGKDMFNSGVDPAYRSRVIQASVESLGIAVKALEPAIVTAHEIPVSPSGLVADTRPPEVFDSDVRVLWFSSPTGRTLGSVLSWGNHPETPWSGNREITADFCGFFRNAVERGVVYDGKVLVQGRGGIHLFINGAVGGLMTTHPSVTVRDAFLGTNFSKPSHEKSRAVGHNLAARVLERLAATNALPLSPLLGVEARTVVIPMTNPNFILAPALGLIDRGQPAWKRIRTEVALLSLGEASMVCIPGEIYPEIVNGGVVRPTGGDFEVDPVEAPSMRSLMPGRVQFVFGLANDEIGYIVPKSEWDQKPPYLFGAAKKHYGEVNSLGPETAPVLYQEIKSLIQARRSAVESASRPQ